MLLPAEGIFIRGRRETGQGSVAGSKMVISMPDARMPSARADLMQVQLIATGQMETEMHKQPIFEEDAFCSLQATRRTLKDRALCAESRQPRDLMRFEERHRTPPPSNHFGLVPRTSGHPIAFFFLKKKSNRYIFAAHCRLPTDELQLLAPGSQRGISMRRGSAARPCARAVPRGLCSHRDLAQGPCLSPPNRREGPCGREGACSTLRVA